MVTPPSASTRSRKPEKSTSTTWLIGMPGQRLHGADRERRAAERVGDVDAVVAVARDGHAQVARDRELGDAVARRVDADEQDRVRAARPRGRAAIGAEHERRRGLREQRASRDERRARARVDALVGRVHRPAELPVAVADPEHEHEQRRRGSRAGSGAMAAAACGRAAAARRERPDGGGGAPSPGRTTTPGRPRGGAAGARRGGGGGATGGGGSTHASPASRGPPATRPAPLQPRPRRAPARAPRSGLRRPSPRPR